MTQTVLLGDVAEYINDKIAVDQISLDDYVSTENLLPEKAGLVGAAKLPGSGKVTKYQKGDVLVSNIRPYFKKIWHADRTGGASNDVLVFRPKTESLSDNYLYYTLKNDHFFDFSTASSGGSKMPRGDKAQIMKYLVYLPDIETQKKIADILGTIDEKIELNRRMNETLEQMGQALFRHYFITNPEAEKWESGTIADLGEVVTGKTPSKAKAEYYGDDVMFLKVPDMHGQPIIIKTEDMLSSLGADSQSKKYVPQWSTCVSCIATVGVVALAGERLQTNQQINSIIPKSKKYTLFNYYLLKSMSEILKTMASGGSATPNLNKGHFENIKVKLPPAEFLENFQNEAEGLLDMVGKNTRQIQTLTTLRDTLLPRLINGKVKA